MTTLQPNDLILNGKYRIDALIGEGAFAQVYRATHLQLQAPRALKILRHDAPGVGSTEFADYAQRFQLEAQLSAKLNNQPHVIQVHDFERDGEMLTLVMEYASGGSLADRIDQARQSRQPIPIDDVIRIALEVADGLAAIHALDVVHRDLKPSNILFDAQGRAKIADLGLAQVPGGPSMRSRLSQSVPHPGTPAYMSPEQLYSYEHLAPAADVYALGAVLFEVLTGRLLRNIRPGTHAKTLCVDMPEWLDELLIKMLTKDYEARPWDGAEVMKAIRLEQGQAAYHRRAAEQTRLAELEQARREAELKQQQQAAEEQRRGEVEAQAKREAEAKAEREAEEKAQHEAEGCARQTLTLTLAPGVTMDFVRVPAGSFLMGNTDQPAKYNNEKPQHTVYLDDYFIAASPVTVAQFAAFVKATNYQCQAGLDVKAKANHPVIVVSWLDAKAFCEWAARQTGVEVRLPTEAEWEKAARGPDGRTYPWGNAEPTKRLCTFNSGYENITTPIGQCSPQGDSPYGCMDMVGNVWEWCTDWFDENYYAQSPAKNPAGPTNGQYRMLRGGGWYYGKTILRASNRIWYSPDARSLDIGFRCAVSVQ